MPQRNVPRPAAVYGIDIGKNTFHVWVSEATACQSRRFVSDATRCYSSSSEQRGRSYFALSSSAIDAAVNGRGVALAQVSMIEEEIQAGTLVVPFDIRLPLSESYYLAWDRAALEKPFGREFHSWVLAIAKKQSVLSAPQIN